MKNIVWNEYGYTDIVSIKIFIEENNIDIENTLMSCKRDVGLGGNHMTSIPIGFDEVQGIFNCSNNKLTNLEKCPRFVKGNMFADRNRISSLEHLPETIGGTFYLNNNGLVSLKGIHNLKNCTHIDLTGNPIVEGGIGLILINDLKVVDYNNSGSVHDGKIEYTFIQALKIIKKYLQKGRPFLLQCANELEEAGYGEFARL